MSAESCYLCRYSTPETDSLWDLASLKLIYGNKNREDFSCMKLCKKHLEFCEKRIPELELTDIAPPKAQPKSFVPKDVKPGKDFTEREPNNGELIE